MRVEVYKNLHNGLMSVREANGRVLTHADAVFINNADFVVQPAGRAKVIREQRKNVHAFVRGELRGFEVGTNKGFDNWKKWDKVSYNPYQSATFFDKTTGDAVHYAPHVVVTTQGVFYAKI